MDDRKKQRDHDDMDRGSKGGQAGDREGTEDMNKDETTIDDSNYENPLVGSEDETRLP